MWTNSSILIMCFPPTTHASCDCSSNPFQGSETCTELLLNHFGKEIVHLRDKKSRTPLHIAAFHDSLLCLQLLLQEGAEVDAFDVYNQTPLMLAAINGHCKSIEVLLEHKADANFQDNLGNTALHHACLQNQEPVALVLLEKCDSIVNMTNTDLKTPLHIAARNGLITVTQTLLLKGANVLATDKNGHTPALSCARDSDVAECLALILAVMPLSATPTSFHSIRLDSFSPRCRLSHCFDRPSNGRSESPSSSLENKEYPVLSEFGL
ncbi:serine/threonine-protein phosphatase 6 regulatory ankyrin repeat subunit A-like [Tachypleus tridentatus]|uniref:serine/threonine-protein phosphatase 6 regulatory ankyrin repeat subunit A-like n=1 Tax=Tachypleus tridentatus TaxID=6853 RepID=UPI003FD57B33